MRFAGSQTVYVCNEYEQVSVPFADLLDSNGNLDIYPEVNSCGYFDIDYLKGKLVLKSKGFVGLVPISDRVAIHVRPRTPIANLMYMVWRARAELPSIECTFAGIKSQQIKSNAPKTFTSIPS